MRPEAPAGILQERPHESAPGPHGKLSLLEMVCRDGDEEGPQRWSQVCAGRASSPGPAGPTCSPNLEEGNRRGWWAAPGKAAPAPPPPRCGPLPSPGL